MLMALLSPLLLLAVARGAADDRVTNMHVSFAFGGCKTGFSCDIGSPTYFDGWRDSRNIYEQGSSLNEEMVLTEIEETSGGCPNYLHAARWTLDDNYVLLITQTFSNCDFTELAELAANLGASAVMVPTPRCLHSEYTSPGAPEMPQEFKDECEALGQPLVESDIETFVKQDMTKLVTIPIVIISRSDAYRYRQCLEGVSCTNTTKIQISLQWNEPVNSNFHWQVWDTASLFYSRQTTPVMFDQRFFELVLPKITDLSFDPYYAVIDDDEFCNSNPNDVDCATRCSEDGRFCLLIPAFASVTTRPQLVLDEIVRRKCLWDAVKLAQNERYRWWSYVKGFYEDPDCVSSFEQCSQTQLVAAGLDRLSISACTSQGDLRLEREAEDYRDSHLGFLERSILVNEKIIFRDHGLDTSANFYEFMKHLCRYYGSDAQDSRLKSECLCLESTSADYDLYKTCINTMNSASNNGGLSPGAIILIVLAVVLLLLMIYGIRRYERRQVRKEVNAELADMLLRYFPEHSDAPKDAARDLLGSRLNQMENEKAKAAHAEAGTNDGSDASSTHAGSDSSSSSVELTEQTSSAKTDTVQLV